MVAQHLAIRHADRVERLVLCCTSSGGAGGASYPLHELEGLDPDERRAVQLSISDTRYGRDWQRANPDDASRIFETMKARETAADDGYRAQLDARSRHDTFDRLGQITAPTLVCAGRYDGIAPLANSEALAAAIPGAELRVHEGGHLFLLQDRQAWTDITVFLGGRQG